MKQRILVASGNAKKLAELRSLCQDLPVEILGPEALPQGLPEVEEDGDTFLANAGKKAFAFAEAAQAQLGEDVWALADDSGLVVDALDGAPGVYSARFAGVEGPERDAANIAHLLHALGDAPEEQRGAAFVCLIAVAHGEELLFAVEGRVEGSILEAPDGDGGFGYDPVFFHPGSGRSFARLSPAEKAAVSHRGEAVAKLRHVLETVLPQTQR
ncbi:MAG: RdgB/HAM1 family non-canonical purine NTP pyrophosphatase [Planctomycetota bacterium]|nr:MAG: RdgB/HAM1 family non-canonical purine NTP pyrophosphatase [Planctomycetota bacterium]